jgi:hypothetical protein
MLWSFGQFGNPGKNYLFFTPGRWGTGVAARMSVGEESPWANEDGLSFSANIGDSVLHHYVVTIDTNNVMRLYVDGYLLKYGDNEQPAIDTLASTHILSKVSNESAFLGRSVYSPDPTWKGYIELYAIWNTALSDENVLWLYQQGAKRGAIVNSIVSARSNNSLNIVVKDNRLLIPELTGNETVQITIYNALGSIVHNNRHFRNGELVNLKKGMYVANIRFDNRLAIVKFINK